MSDCKAFTAGVDGGGLGSTCSRKATWPSPKRPDGEPEFCKRHYDVEKAILDERLAAEGDLELRDAIECAIAADFPIGTEVRVTGGHIYRASKAVLLVLAEAKTELQ